MKYIDEYRRPELVQGLLAAVGAKAAEIGREVTIMEICGTHTHAIGKYGLRRVLPANLRLISGPGCPVCVTSIGDVDAALHLAGLPGVIFATFGDMLRVPGTGGESLTGLRAAGADIRVISSAGDAVRFAAENPDRQVVLMGIGFETTAPTVAAAVLRAKQRGLENFCVFSVHKTVPKVIEALLADPELNIDGFICPGHVSVITGTEAYRVIPEAGRAAVITGFEPVDIAEGILMILHQIASGKFDVAIQYSRGVKEWGNARAREVMAEVFEPGDADWRGLGVISGSGLCIRREFAEFDALRRFDLPAPASAEVRGCGCGEVLRGVLTPPQCRLFLKACTPANPLGPCMVSGEGTCAAYYKYERDPG